MHWWHAFNIVPLSLSDTGDSFAVSQANIIIDK